MNVRLYNYRNSNDLAACAKLFVRVFTAPQFEFSWLTEKKAAAYISDMVNTPKSLSFVCLNENGSILGACFGVVNDCFASDYYDIKEIFIMPERQSQGLGTIFLSEIELYLRNNNITSISLNTDKNTPAYHFYEKNGYNVSPSSVLMFKKI